MVADFAFGRVVELHRITLLSQASPNPQYSSLVGHILIEVQICRIGHFIDRRHFAFEAAFQPSPSIAPGTLAM
jgi:hypothetical protein